MQAGDAVLREQVHQAYSAIAQQPAALHPFTVGRVLAEGIGYPPELLDQMPRDAVDAFAGVSYVPGFAEIPRGAHVLDVGCGAGLDSLIASQAAARVTGVDFSEEMLGRCRDAARQLGATNVEFRKGDAENLPVATAAVDVVLVNGIFNLNPARSRIFEELARVVRGGGCVFAAELIRKDGAPAPAPGEVEDWFA